MEMLLFTTVEEEFTEFLDFYGSGRFIGFLEGTNIKKYMEFL